jgi:hypothetical protein
VGLVINVKEIGSSSSNKKKYVRVMISKGLPDEIWAFDEIALWIRPKRRID